MAFSAISAENGYHVSNIQIIMVTIPACICGILMAVAYSWHRGLDLDKDPLFQARLKDPVQHNYIYGNSATVLDKKIAPESKRAVYIFLVALGIIVMFSLTSMMGINLLPSFDQVQVVSGGPEQITLANGVTESAKQLAKAGVVVAGVTKKVTEPITMNIVIQITMIAAAALMVIFCKAKPKLAVSGAVWQSGYLWYRLDGQYLFRQLQTRDAGYAHKLGHGLSLDHRPLLSSSSPCLSTAKVLS